MPPLLIPLYLLLLFACVCVSVSVGVRRLACILAFSIACRK